MGGSEFDSLTLPEVRRLYKAWETRESRKDLRAGMIVSMIANTNRDPKTCPDPFAPWDFFPSLERLKPKPLTAEETFNLLRATLC